MSSQPALDLAHGPRAALLLIDVQNDFLAPDGAYRRAGVSAPELTALPARLAPVVEQARARGLPLVSAQFTLVAPGDGAPIVAAHLRAKRPFLGRGDFAPGSRGHRLVDALAPADVVVEKVAYSAFHQSRLGWVLHGLGIERLVVAGLLTDGGVASTVRDAQIREYDVVLLGDGCASFDVVAHDAALRSLAAVATVVTCAEAIAAL